ncbi:alanine--glyoxylate aminotransferase family protein [Mesobacillus maritimus]|uniref:pyridoxal-phosphate-dependent aminotransferase family protein n=1 Tax=Mesobacillus maritimus TaxID=1643336 RepID=UPI00203D76AA|nr:alanine--glyoxylate aminotransferase family protein [Mesobacillus maritimus]MCM3585954.1 alanine--glyoxylate aminotransferase family protein [Mesobacillus maritimus]MCM3670385.1 alanine--glyoxylate aminotransferase family protein [Mesobacillus maritimus]
MFQEKMDLRLPGPVQVPKEIQIAMQQSFDHPMMDYRNPAFQEVLQETIDKAKMVFQTKNLVVPLTSSGASALETAIINTVGANDTIILCVVGYFGEYLQGITDHIGCKVVRVEAEWGKVVDPEEVRAALKDHPEAKAVFATHCETSTSAINNIKEIAAIVRETEAIFMVDAVSSIVGTPLYMDDWGIDIVATGGQKALMLPPGLALITMSDKAWKIIEKHQCPSFYLDLKKYKKGLESGVGTPYTPNIALVCGLKEACNMIERGGGMEQEYKRHAALRDMTRAGVRALGLELFVEDSAASPTLTAVKLENADAFRKLMREEFHIALGGGLGKVKNKILRLGHMGYTDAADMLKMFAAMELALKKSGYEVELGAGVAGAQKQWLENPNC